MTNEYPNDAAASKHTGAIDGPMRSRVSLSPLRLPVPLGCALPTYLNKMRLQAWFMIDHPMRSNSAPRYAVNIDSCRVSSLGSVMPIFFFILSNAMRHSSRVSVLVLATSGAASAALWTRNSDQGIMPPPSRA